MKEPQTLTRIAIAGAGPSGLFMLKTLLDSGNKNTHIDIFEAGETTGSGFPYSGAGASYEHITNVSGNEIPPLQTTTTEWLQTLPAETLRQYGINKNEFTEYHVFPRLLFGQYLHTQFNLLLQRAAAAGIAVRLHLNSRVTDIIDHPENGEASIQAGGKLYKGFHHIIICTGHYWPASPKANHPGYYDAPYPPAGIAKIFNHAIALKGSSLTAIDAIRTLAQHNGRFSKDGNDKLVFTLHEKSQGFSIVMYSLKGLLPGVRFHLQDSHLSASSLLTEEEINCHRRENDGFLSLDFIFEKDFKEPLRKIDPAFYNHIKDMTMEAFVEEMMGMRERAEPFALLRAEYAEAERSIQQRRSVHWKEMLAVLSFAMNYPAKHFSAEDMQRLQKVLMSLIAVIIAFVPQDSCEELFALHDAGCLSIIAVEKDSHVKLNPAGGIVYVHTDEEGKEHAIPYQTFIDCTGQPALWIKDFPFTSLAGSGTVSQALLPFRAANNAKSAIEEGDKNIIEKDGGKFYLQVPGIAISDCFNVTGTNGLPNPRLYMMAVPFIGGYNPDYSGLDFCEAAAGKIVTGIFK